MYRKTQLTNSLNWLDWRGASWAMHQNIKLLTGEFVANYYFIQEEDVRLVLEKVLSAQGIHS